MSAQLAKLGILTIEDLLHYYPRAWEDRRVFLRLREAKVDQPASFFGEIEDVGFTETARGFAVVKALIRDDSGTLACKWMRRKSFKYDILAPFRKALKPGVSILVYGKVGLDFEGKSLNVEEYEVFSDPKASPVHINRIVPVYPATEGVSPKFLRKLIHEVLKDTELTDPLPGGVEELEGLIPLKEALAKIHFPQTLAEKDQARLRLAFQELFMIQTVLAIARKRRRVSRGFRNEIKKNILTPFRQGLGFEFTASQKKVIREIFGDLQSEFPMNRLLQGDVGSGKTVVALSAMLLAAENGSQSVLMAPTEILAEQHFITLKHFLRSLPVRAGLLTGSVKGKEREAFLKDCEEGKIDIAVGTHALLEKEVKFKRLGLVAIDEQHRFGVRHRLLLTQRKPVPDVLVMTATPIPRTLAMGLYGDLDVSTIDELPPGRQEIQTLLRSEEEALRIVREQAAAGRQAYVVCPLIDESKSLNKALKEEDGGDLLALAPEESRKLKLKGALQEFEELKEHALKGAGVGLLHGKMKGKEKEKAMVDFLAGKFSVLVATTVIEVGIDVPNATVIVIQNADRFGLSTLHQLRGRIGRGKDRSYCVLVGSPKTEEAKLRIETLLKVRSGFKLAEVDLSLRGAGDIFGTSQHGIPPLKIADFRSDLALVVRSQKRAQEWIDADPDLAVDENRALRDYLKKHFAKTWHWANIA